MQPTMKGFARKSEAGGQEIWVTAAATVWGEERGREQWAVHATVRGRDKEGYPLLL